MSEPLIECDICLICSERIEPMLALEIAGVPHGRPGHNVQYSRRVLGVCPNCDHGQLECYAHDCWDHPADEDWDMYWWYVLEPDEQSKLDALLKRCPAPLDATCACEVHVPLRRAAQRLYGGIRHAVSPSSRARFAYLTLDTEGEAPTLRVRQS
jgi:hypothetical protein